MLPKQESRIEAGYLCSPVLLSAQPVSSYPISGILSPGAAVILVSHGGAPVPYQAGRALGVLRFHISP